MFKKEVLIIFVSLFFLIGAGCDKNGMDYVKEEITFDDWINSPPLKYSLYNEEYSSQIKSAVYGNNAEKCDEILDEDRSRESVLALIDCKRLLIKLDAFNKKDFEICKELYEEDSIDNDYDECMAPIVAYSAIMSNDKSGCKKYLNNERLIDLCEDDYERYH